MKVEVKATYIVLKTLILEVEAGSDPTDPSTWIEIESEHDSDCNLYDVLNWEALE